MDENNCCFENVTEYSYDNLLETGKRLFYKREKLIVIVYCVIAGVAFIMVVAKLLSHSEHSASMESWILLTILALFLALYFIIRPYMWAKKFYKSGTRRHVRFQINAEKLIASREDGSNPMEVPLLEIFGIFQTVNCYVLQIPGNRVLLLSKDGFSQGNEAAFQAHLKKFCSNAKWR